MRRYYIIQRRWRKECVRIIYEYKHHGAVVKKKILEFYNVIIFTTLQGIQTREYQTYHLVKT